MTSIGVEGQRISALPAELEATPAGGLVSPITPGRVEVNLGALEELARGAEVLAELASAGLVDAETVGEVRAGLSERCGP